MTDKHVDFLFVYEVKARELENICLLACELERRGYTTAIVNSWTMLKKKKDSGYSCDTLVISACYNDEVYRFFTGFARRYKKVFCLQWEQVPVNYSYESTEKTSWTYQETALHVRNVCWGRKSWERLVEKFGVDENCARITGYIALDLYLPQFRPLLKSREQLLGEIGADPKKKTCLFVSSFAYVNLPPALEATADEDGKSLTKKISSQSQKLVLAWIEKILERYPDVQFIYRPHPSEAENPDLLTMQRKHRGFFCVPQFTIRHWIAACDKVYIWNSTSAIEAWVSGVKTYLLRPVSLPRQCDMPIFENSKAIQTYEAFETSVLDQEESNPSLDPAVLDQWYGLHLGQAAYLNICDWLEETRSDSAYQSPQLPRYASVPCWKMWFEYNVVYVWMNFIAHRFNYRLCCLRGWITLLGPEINRSCPRIVRKLYKLVGCGARLAQYGLCMLFAQKQSRETLLPVRRVHEVQQALEAQRLQYWSDRQQIRQTYQQMRAEFKRMVQNRDTRQKKSYDASKYLLNRSSEDEINRIKHQINECL